MKKLRMIKKVFFLVLYKFVSILRAQETPQSSYTVYVFQLTAIVCHPFYRYRHSY
jgi:hypothetical protein